MTTPARKRSGLSTLFGLLLCVVFIGGVIGLDGLDGFLRWYKQLVVLNVETTCTTELISKEGSFDYYEVTAPMPDDSTLVLEVREPANQTIFQPGKCAINSWQKWLGTWVNLQDADMRSWGLRATSESTYDPRGPWDFWRSLALTS